MTNASWVVALCQSGRETETAKWFEEHGAETFVAMAKHHRKIRHKSKPVVQEFPAFPKYIFLGHIVMSSLWWLLSRAKERGLIHSVVSMDGSYVIVPNRVVEDVKLAQSQGLFDRLPPKMSMVFNLGTEVEVILGPLKGYVGKVVRERSGHVNRVMVEISCGRMMRPANFHISNLKVIGHTSKTDDRCDPVLTH